MEPAWTGLCWAATGHSCKRGLGRRFSPGPQAIVETEERCPPQREQVIGSYPALRARIYSN